MAYGDSPLMFTIQEGEELIGKLLQASDELGEAIADEKIAKARYQDAKEMLQAAEAERVSEWELMSGGGEGPFKGLARTSKSFTIALDHALNQARSSDAELAMLARQERDYGVKYMNASIRLEQATSRFSALRHAAELKAAVLHASRL